VPEVAQTLLLAAHLLCVNAAAGGPLVAAWLDWCAAGDDSAAAQAARLLARYAIAGLLVGALLGLAIGWLNWNSAYQSLWLGPLRYKLHVAAMEAVFSLAMLLGWWLWLPKQAGGKRWAALTRGVVALLASSNLLYHFPSLFSVAARLYDSGEVTGPTISGPAFRQLMLSGETPALAMHVALASVAVAGVLLLGLALRSRRQGDEAAANRLALLGGRFALVPTVLQLPVGLWMLAMIAPTAQSEILGGSALGTVLFFAAMLTALWLMRELASVALGETERPVLIRAMAALLITVVLMAALARQTRQPPTPANAAQSIANRNAETVR
jgi:hypothetical protein